MAKATNLSICLLMCAFCGLFGYILRGEQIYKAMWENQVSLTIVDGVPAPGKGKMR